MDYVNPTELVAETLQLAKKKAAWPVRDLLVRGILAGVFLGYGTSMTLVILAQGLPAIVGAALFPAGFVMLVLLGFELATGNFALLPAGFMAGQVRLRELLRNWSWVYLGNLIGGAFYAFLFYLAITNCGTSNGGALGEQVRQLAQKKTLAYMSLGARGWVTALVKGLLCNWMVTFGAVLALASRSTIGKIVGMWLPIMIFFAHGYEHSIVNMFVIPAGMLLGAPVSIGQWWLWNQIPVTFGNIFAGALFTGLALYTTYASRPAPAVEAARALPEDDDAVLVPRGLR
jgi:formate/nitrite transporter